MTGLDTNIVVRYVTQDDPVQSALAVRLIRSLSPEEPGFLSLVVMAELCWVLETCYRFTKAELIDVFESLLSSKEIVVERADLVAQAIRRFATGRADFADYLIERCGHIAGCADTLTFDQIAAASAGMRLLK